MLAQQDFVPHLLDIVQQAVTAALKTTSTQKAPISATRAPSGDTLSGAIRAQPKTCNAMHIAAGGAGIGQGHALSHHFSNRGIIN